MAKNNRLDWCEWMSVDNLELMGILKTKREATAIGIRDKLLEAGLIQYTKGKKGIPSKYKMVSLSKMKVQSVVNTVAETADITKQNKTKLKRELGLRVALKGFRRA